MNDTTNTETLGICQALTMKDLEGLHKDYMLSLTPEKSLHDLCTLLFRKMRIRTISELDEQADERAKQVAMDIRSDFYKLQQGVVTSVKTRKVKVTHKKGDPIRDEKGNPLTDGTNADGSIRYQTYPRDTIDYVDEEYDVPYFDYLKSIYAWDKLKAFIKQEEVLPDFTIIEKKMSPTPDFNRGLELIRNITKYYEFEEPEKFIERFALLICNAKAKGLNKQPKWPVMFSLVGKMGRGKGWLRNMIKDTYDEVFETRSQACKYKALLDTRFNSLMLTRGFLCLDEKNGLDSKMAEELKTNISEPTVLVECKGRDPKSVRNLTTFFSCSNETIKDVMGLQRDRRIVEFCVVGKKGEMPEQELRDTLIELWKTMPCECPVADKVINELLDESGEVLDTKMCEIVTDLFNNHSVKFLKGRYVNSHALKECVKEMGGVRFMPVLDWCLENGILRKQNNGSYTLLKKGLDDAIEKQKRNESIDGTNVFDAPNVPCDIDDLLNAEVK